MWSSCRHFMGFGISETKFGTIVDIDTVVFFHFKHTHIVWRVFLRGKKNPTAYDILTFVFFFLLIWVHQLYYEHVRANHPSRCPFASIETRKDFQSPFNLYIPRCQLERVRVFHLPRLIIPRHSWNARLMKQCERILQKSYLQNGSVIFLGLILQVLCEPLILLSSLSLSGINWRPRRGACSSLWTIARHWRLPREYHGFWWSRAPEAYDTWVAFWNPVKQRNGDWLE